MHLFLLIEAQLQFILHMVAYCVWIDNTNRANMSNEKKLQMIWCQQTQSQLAVFEWPDKAKGSIHQLSFPVFIKIF